MTDTQICIGYRTSNHKRWFREPKTAAKLMVFIYEIKQMIKLNILK